MNFSVIIPIYNGKEFLPRLMETLSAFTVSDFECIFVDNNSTDGSPEVIKQLLKQVSFPYQVLSESQQGAGPTRNTGIRHAQGKYLAFLDCDDVILPDKLEKDLEIFKSEDVDFVFCRTQRIYQNKPALLHPIDGIKEGINLPDTLGMIWLQNYFKLQGTGALTAKKEVVQNLGGFGEFLTGQDAFLFILMGLKYKGFFYSEIKFRYYRHPNSTISTSNRNDSSLHRYLDLRKNLFVAPEIRAHKKAFSTLCRQINIDLFKLHVEGAKLDDLLVDPRLRDFTPSKRLLNSFSLGLNRILPNYKFNPFWQWFARTGK